MSDKQNSAFLAGAAAGIVGALSTMYIYNKISGNTGDAPIKEETKAPERSVVKAGTGLHIGVEMGGTGCKIAIYKETGNSAEPLEHVF